MPKKKNYLHQYKKTYLKNTTTRVSKRLVSVFILATCISAILLAYIFIRIENSSNEQHNEASLVINQAVSVKKKSLRTDFTSWNHTCNWNLIVINENNAIPKYYCPALRLLGDIEIDEHIFFDISEMLHDAATDGIKLWVSTGYRSFERQEHIFNRNLNNALTNGLTKNEAFREVRQESPLPGYSEHHTGLAIDFNAAGLEFSDTPDYAWLIEHSQNYGFILRYPQDKESITGRPFEPAHFRYVGEEHAHIMKAQNVCLEEYISSLTR